MCSISGASTSWSTRVVTPPPRRPIGSSDVDTRAIDLPTTAVVACIVVRNEADRLPALLAHHRQLGVQRFFVVDNESTDDTLRMLVDEADVHVWSSSMPFQAANFGAAWFEVILRAHAPGHWVVIVDADELLWYPEWESRSLPEFCAALEDARPSRVRRGLARHVRGRAGRATRRCREVRHRSTCAAISTGGGATR